MQVGGSIATAVVVGGLALSNPVTAPMAPQLSAAASVNVAYATGVARVMGASSELSDAIAARDVAWYHNIPQGSHEEVLLLSLIHI